MPIAPGKPAALWQERGASAKRAQADLRKGLMSSSSLEPSAPGKLAALFSCGSEEPGNQFKSAVFKKLTRQIWEDLFLKATKITSSVRQDLNLWSKSIKLDLSTIASVSYSNMLMLKDWNWRTKNTEKLNLEENKYVYKKSYLWRKKFSQILKSDICMRSEKWRELKIYELTNSLYGSHHKCRKCSDAHICKKAVDYEFYTTNGTSQQRQQMSELQFGEFPTPQSFLVWKIRFKNQATTCSDFPLEAMLWIKEVEMFESLEELKSSRSFFGENFPNFEMLDAEIASALNKIIQNSHFKRR